MPLSPCSKGGPTTEEFRTYRQTFKENKGQNVRWTDDDVGQSSETHSRPRKYREIRRPETFLTTKGFLEKTTEQPKTK